MFCQNCGKQNPDGAMFCEGCGSFLNTAPAAQEAKPAGNNVVDGLLGYVKNPKEASSEGNIMSAGIFAGINFLAIFVFLWRYIGAYFTKLADVMDMSVDELIQKQKIEYGIFPMLVAALGIAIICIAATAGIIFLIKKLNKQDADLMQIAIKAAMDTMIPSALLIVGALLSFLVWWFFPITVIAIIVLWIVNIFAEVGNKDNQMISSGVIAVVLMVVMLLTSLLASWGIGEATMRDKSMNEDFEESDRSVCHIIFDALMTTED